MDGKVLFESCLAQASAVIEQVKADQFDLPTPDTKWDVRTLVSHMLYELSWVADILDGKTDAAVGSSYNGDLIGTDLPTNWRIAAGRALVATAEVDQDRLIHLSYGDYTAAHYLREQANDQLIHAWDLGEAIGVPVLFDPAVAKALYEMALPRQLELAASGLFAPPLPVPDSADTQTKLLALLGRHA
jgi:uncharacterized protein (TIGR03086 family)